MEKWRPQKKQFDEKKTEGEGVLSEEEANILARNYARNGGKITEKGFSEIINWASNARIDNATLECVLKGALDVSIVKGEVSFQAAKEKA